MFCFSLQEASFLTKTGTKVVDKAVPVDCLPVNIVGNLLGKGDNTTVYKIIFCESLNASFSPVFGC